MVLTTLAQEVISKGPNLLPYVGTAAGTGFYAVKGVQSVPDGFVGLRTRFKNARLPHANDIEDKLKITENDLRSFVTHGRLPKFHWPLTHSIVLISTQDQVANLATVIDVEEDDRPCRPLQQLAVRGQVGWGVKPDKISAYRALYMPASNDKGLPNPANLVHAVEGELGGGFWQVMQSMSEAERRSPEASENVREQMLTLCKDGLERYGSEIRWVRLQEAARTVGHMFVEANVSQNSQGYMGLMLEAATVPQP